MSIITNEIEERYPYPDNGERPTGITSLGQCLASRKAYRAGVCRKITDREIDAAALAVGYGLGEQAQLGERDVQTVTQEVRRTGDVKRLCLTVKTGGRIDAITCQVLDGMTGELK
jgi:hypothetical protein